MTQKHPANDNQTSFLTKMKGWIEYAGAVHALSRLDDNALGQIGIKRSEIHTFVKSWNDNHTTDAA